MLDRCSSLTRDDIDFYIFSHYCHPYHKEVLAMLGIPEHKVISNTEYPHLKCRNLITSAPPLGESSTKESLDFFRSKFLSRIAPTEPHAKIYISRSKGKRRVVNELELIDLLLQYGFQIIELEDLQIVEQAQVFNSARVIVAPHGAGLTNLIFCNPKAKLLEIFSPKYVWGLYYLSCHYYELDYCYFIADSATPDQPLSTYLTNSFDDIYIDLPSFRPYFEAWLNGSN